VSVKIYAIQTGSVQIKTAQLVRKPGGTLRILTDSHWTEALPIFAWVIDHPEGMIVVDTGDTAQTADPRYFPRWHPYYRTSVRMRVQPDQENRTTHAGSTARWSFSECPYHARNVAQHPGLCPGAAAGVFANPRSGKCDPLERTTHCGQFRMMHALLDTQRVHSPVPARIPPIA
jgi:hypothetical protein